MAHQEGVRDARQSLPKRDNGCVADVVYVVVILAIFATLAVIVRGIERL